MDLKIEDVAKLLNISQEAILRWLAEGSIPAYRIDEEYRFSRPEIEDWILTQQLEGGEEVKGESGNLQYSLTRALYRGDVFTHLCGESKESLIESTMHEVGKRFDLDAAVLSDLFLDRERRMSTALSHGIAVPHTRDFLLDTHFDVLAIVYPKEPIAWGALDKEPVHTLFFLFASDDRNHLHLLSKVAHLSASEKSRAFFQTKPSKEALLKHIKAFEAAIA